jgi:transposase
MAMGRRGDEQQGLFVPHTVLPKSDGHPFYEALERVLGGRQFDRFVEELCAPYYAKKMGRPSLAPGVYFRCLMVGYFEGIDSERGIAWRAADSLSLRRFIGIDLGKATPDHSTISRTRRLIPSETHREVFTWVLKVVAEAGLLRGKTLGVDGTTLEANAAMRSIVRRDDGRTYQEYLTDLAKASGIETPTRDDLARMDRKRKGRKTSNEDWRSPSDPDAQITKMKDGRTHLAHKQEHAVDMETGVVVAVEVHGAVEGDTSTVTDTIEEAEKNLDDVRTKLDPKDASKVAERATEFVGDKGYHSKMVLKTLDLAGYRTYISEPSRGRRKWDADAHGQQVTYANRRRIRGKRGRRLMRRRGALIERSFAHNLETGGMRRTHLRLHDNILKRVLVHVAAFNLGIVMRALFKVGKPRVLQGRAALAALLQSAVEELCAWLITSLCPEVLPLPPRTWLDRPSWRPPAPALTA